MIEFNVGLEFAYAHRTMMPVGHGRGCSLGVGSMFQAWRSRYGRFSKDWISVKSRAVFSKQLWDKRQWYRQPSSGQSLSHHMGLGGGSLVSQHYLGNSCVLKPLTWYEVDTRPEIKLLRWVIKRRNSAVAGTYRPCHTYIPCSSSQRCILRRHARDRSRMCDIRAANIVTTIRIHVYW